VIDLDLYIARTCVLMAELQIPIRDTYSKDDNLDDFYSNGGRYGGPRLVKVSYEDSDGISEMKANRIYHVPPLRSAAYDAFSIVVPNRFRADGRDDPIVHELVHFLQHNTVEEDSRYIKFNGTNYDQYLCQRTEMEAHSVQVLDILRTNPQYCARSLSEEDANALQAALDQLSRGGSLNSFFPMLQLCKARGLIG